MVDEIKSYKSDQNPVTKTCKKDALQDSIVIDLEEPKTSSVKNYNKRVRKQNRKRRQKVVDRPTVLKDIYSEVAEIV